MTSEPIPFSSGQDPLLRDVPLDHRIESSVFGVPVVFESNAAHVTDLVERRFGRSDGGERRDEPGTSAPIRLRVVLEANRRGSPVLEQMQWRIPERDHALFSSPGIVGWLDMAAAEGTIYVEEETVRAHARFTAAVIDGPVLTLLSRRDRQPVHGAALRRGDAALILHGQSGTGKSTLCYAASRSGIDVLSDDVVRVQRKPELRIWGQPGHVHLLEETRSRFPELYDHHEVDFTAGGQLKHVVALPGPAPVLPAFVRRARVCLLSRTGRRIACAVAAPEEIVRAVIDAPESRFNLSPDGQLGAVRALAAPGGWKLELSDDPFESIPRLREMLVQI